MRIAVKRGWATRFTTNISDPLITSLPVALARGEQELNAGTGLLPVTIETVYRPTARVGDLIEVYDELQGSIWQGVCTSVEHTMDDNLELITKLGVHR